MKERPITFITPMVQAILEGRKTMTRRILKPQPTCIDYTWDNPLGLDHLGRVAIQDNDLMDVLSCPYGKPGDLLWVKETYETGLNRVNYKAGNPEVKHNTAYANLTKWKPSRFMPRSASRITLKIISIGLEHLRNISQEDARKEGIFCSDSPIGPCYMDYHSKQCNAMTTARISFRSLWESINGKGSWEKNPWVWAIEFERLKS